METIQVPKEQLEKLLQLKKQYESENSALKQGAFLILDLITLTGIDLTNPAKIGQMQIITGVTKLFSNQNKIEKLFEGKGDLINQLKQIYENEQRKHN